MTTSNCCPPSGGAVNHYGVKTGHRVYDSKELKPHRGQPSGVKSRKDLWEVHRDPYDITRVWVRNHRSEEGEWITAYWKVLNGKPAPFGQLAWDHALADLREKGCNPTEAEIAQAAQDLMTRAHAGPEETLPRPGRKATARERRVAALTDAATPSIPPASPAENRQPPPSPQTADEPAVNEEQELARVVPLGTFDAHREAKRRW